MPTGYANGGVPSGIGTAGALVEWLSATVVGAGPALTAILLAANNLHDVLDAGSSRFNLSIPTLSAAAAVAVANVNIASPGATLDSYTIQASDEILLTNQSTSSQNGVWTWNGSATALTRPNEFPTAGVVKRGRMVAVINGTSYANTIWVLDSTAVGLTIDTSAQPWTIAKSSGVATVTAGDASAVIGGTTSNPTVESGTLNQIATLHPPTGSWSNAGNKITGGATPTAATDFAIKSYVDALSLGLSVKPAVQWATTGSETYTIVSGSVTVISGTSIDGNAPAVNDRILIKNAPASSGAGSGTNTTQAPNGIYTVVSNVTNLTVTLATDMNTGTQVPGAFTFCEGGTANKGAGFVVAGEGPYTIGTTPILWTQFTGGSSYTVDSTLTLTGSVLGRAAITGDVTIAAGSDASVLKSTGPGATGPDGSATLTPVITIDAQGRVTALSTVTTAPPFSAVTGQTTLGQLPSISADTVLGNATGSTATPTAVPMTGTGSSSAVMSKAATLVPKDLNGTVFVDAANSAGWSGSDVGAWINAAYAYLLATYGTTISGPPAGYTGAGVIDVGPGTFTYTTPIVCADQFFAIKIKGHGDGVGHAAGPGLTGTVLNYTPTTGIAMTLAGASNNTGGVQLEDICLQGAGSGNSTTGLQWGLTAGGSPPPGSSTAGATATCVAIQGFGTGEVWNPSPQIAYAVNHYNCKVQFNGTGVTPLGEANNWFGGLIANNATGIAGSNSGDALFFGTAFDDNTTTAINSSTGLFRSTFTGCRFENANGGTDTYVTQTAGSVTVLGGTMQSDLTTGTSTGFGQLSGGTFICRDTWLLGQGSRTFTQAFNCSSNAICRATPNIAPGSVGITTIQQPGYTDQGVIARNGNGVTSGTGATVLFNAQIPTNAQLGVGSYFRIRMFGNSSSTGTLAFVLHAGAAGTNADAAIWTPATSAAQVANHRSSIECLVRYAPSSNKVFPDGVARFSNLFVEEATIAAQTGTAIVPTAPWFLTLTCACSVGTFSVDEAVVEIL